MTLWSINQEIIHVWHVMKKIKSNYTAPLAPSCACNIMEVQISAIFFAYYINIPFTTKKKKRELQVLKEQAWVVDA